MLIPFVTASAAYVDLDAPCGITVLLPTQYVEDQESFVVDIYKIADFDAFEDGTNVAYRVSEGPFYGLKGDLDSANGKEAWSAIAKKALGIVESSITTGNEIEHMPGILGENVDLDAGVYLVVARGMDQEAKFVYDDDDNPYATVAKTPLHEYVFSPVIVTLPLYDGNGEDGDEINGNGGSWSYYAEVKLKPERNDLTKKKIILQIPNAIFIEVISELL